MPALAQTSSPSALGAGTTLPHHWDMGGQRGTPSHAKDRVGALWARPGLSQDVPVLLASSWGKELHVQPRARQATVKHEGFLLQPWGGRHLTGR